MTFLEELRADAAAREGLPLRKMSATRDTINPLLLHYSPTNFRRYNTPENREHIEALKRSLKARGVWEASKPLLIYLNPADGKYYIHDGGCRHRALMQLLEEGEKWRAVPFVLMQKSLSEERAMASQIGLNCGKPFSDVELAFGIVQMQGKGWNDRDIAKETGLELSKVRRLVKVAELPQLLIEKIESGEMSVTMALELVAKQGEKGACEAVKKASPPVPTILPPEIQCTIEQAKALLDSRPKGESFPGMSAAGVVKVKKRLTRKVLDAASDNPPTSLAEIKQILKFALEGKQGDSHILMFSSDDDFRKLQDWFMNR